MKQKIKYDFTNAIKDNVTNGVSIEDIKSLSGRLQSFLSSFRKNPPGFVNILNDTAGINAVLDAAERYKKYENFVVVGIGGSALGLQAIKSSLLSPGWNTLDNYARMGHPRLFVMDNVDPEHISHILENIDLTQTIFNIISKSGSTAETMANYMVVRGMLEENNLDPVEHLIFTTDAQEGVLRKISTDEKIPSFVIPSDVGGRFSVLTPVGLLGAAVAGIDIHALMEGAKESVNSFLSETDVLKNAVLLNAAIHYLHSNAGKKVSVMMAYSNALYPLADWYRQLWAESLGKEKTLTGELIYAGQTPVKALGTIDQHSQVQLYMEGPNDKIITFLKVEKFRKEIIIPGVHVDQKAFSYLKDVRMSKLLNSEQKATALALLEKGRPSLTIGFDEITPFETGMFFGYYELVVSVMGFLYGINTFDQPGVELGKQNTYALMEKEGYESQRKHIEEVRKKLKPLIL